MRELKTSTREIREFASIAKQEKMGLKARSSDSKLVFFLSYSSQTRATDLEETWGQFAFECPRGIIQ